MASGGAGPPTPTAPGPARRSPGLRFRVLPHAAPGASDALGARGLCPGVGRGTWGICISRGGQGWHAQGSLVPTAAARLTRASGHTGPLDGWDSSPPQGQRFRPVTLLVLAGQRSVLFCLRASGCPGSGPCAREPHSGAGRRASTRCPSHSALRPEPGPPGLPGQRGQLGGGRRVGKPSPSASAEGGSPGPAVSAASLTLGGPVWEDVAPVGGAADQARAGPEAGLCSALQGRLSHSAPSLGSVGAEGPPGCVLGPEGPWEASVDLPLYLLVWNEGPQPKALAVVCAGLVLTSQHVAAVWGHGLEGGGAEPRFCGHTLHETCGGQGQGREEWTESGPSPESGCAQRREGGACTVLGGPECLR